MGMERGRLSRLRLSGGVDGWCGMSGQGLHGLEGHVGVYARDGWGWLRLW